MADYEISLHAKLDESSLDSINGEIEKLQGSLTKLKIQAEVDPKVISGIERRIKDLEKLVTKIQLEVDTSKATEAINNIGKTTGKSGQKSGQQFGNSMNQAVRQSLNIDTIIDNQVEKIMDSFGIIGKKGSVAFGEIKKAVLEFKKEMGDSGSETFMDPDDIFGLVGSSSGINKVTDTIAKYIKVKNEEKEVYSNLAKYIKETNDNGTKIHLPKSIQEEFGDDFSAMRSSLGKAFTTSGNGIDFESYLTELNAQLGNVIDLSQGAEHAFEDLVNKTKMGRGGKYYSSEDLFDSGILDRSQIEETVTSAIDVISAAEQKIVQQSTSATNEFVQNEERKQDAIQETAEKYRSFSELEVSSGRESVDVAFDSNGNMDVEKTKQDIRDTFKEFGQVRLTKELIDSDGLKECQVNIQQINGELKETQSFMLELSSDGKSFVFSDDTIKGTQSIVHHLNEEKNATSKVLTEQEKLANAMANVREKSELARQSEQKRQELAQANAINKSLEEEYKNREKLNQEQIQSSYQKLQAIAKEAGNKELGLFKLNPDTDLVAINKLEEELDQLGTRYTEIINELNSKGLDLSPAQYETLGKIFEDTGQKLSDLKAQLKDKIDIGIDTGKFETQLISVENKMKQFSVESDDLKGKAAELREAFNIMSSPDRSIDEKIAAYRQFSAILPSVNNELKQLGEEYRLTAAEQNTLTRSQTLSNNIQTWMNENRKAAEKYGETLKQLQTQLNGNTNQKVEQQARLSFNNIKSQSRMFGLVDSSMVQSLKNTALYMAGFGSMFQAVNTMVRNIKEAATFAKELDSALTNINYTMDVTSSQLETVGNKSIDMAKDLHTSTENVLQAVTLYANAKETTDTILEKAQPAIMLSNVTGFSGEESAKYLQTIMNQFDLTQDDLMDISDTIQAVSQNIAHDFSDGIVQINEGISTSGEVARSAGMSLAEYASMIGLLVEKTGLAGSQIGNSIKTIITRTTKASKILGIDEGEISDAEKALKTVGINVRESDGEFREFNDTMTDLAKVWDTLSDVEQSNISFALAGTRQTSIIKSLLRSYDEYLNLVETVEDASGTTFENQEKYVESLEGKMEHLSTTMQSAWHNIINENEVSSVIGVLQNFANVIDSLTDKLGLFKTVGIGVGIGAIAKSIA